MTNNTVFTEPRTSKAIFTLALPAMLGQLTTLIYNLADTYFVSLTNDPNQIAAVTLCAPILLILMSLGVVFGAGGSSIIARLLGAGKTEKARNIASYCFYSVFICSVVIVVCGILFLDFFVQILGVDADNMAFTRDYMFYILLGTPFLMFGNCMVHIFRSAGLFRQATIGLMLGNFCNIILDFIFIVLLHWGTAGAALATSLGFVLNSAYFIFCIRRQQDGGQGVLSLSLRDYCPSLKMTGQVLAIGIPGALITVLMSVANIILNNYIGIYSSNAVAAYGIANKINTVPILLSVGLAQGVAPLIGYCCGSDENQRLKKVMRLTMLYGLIMGCFFTCVYIFLHTSLVSLFLKREELVALSGHFLRILCFSGPILIVVNMVPAYYQAVGKAFHSLALTICRNVFLLIPIVMLFNNLFALDGVIAAQPVVETIVAIICLVMYEIEARRNLH